MIESIKRKLRTADDEGFTLIELLVVVLILGILMAIAIPTFLSLTSNAKTNAAEADLTTATQDEAAYFTVYGDFDGTTASVPTAADNVLATSNPPGVAATDPGINWTTTTALSSATAGRKIVYVSMVSATQLILGTAGQNGNFYWVSDLSGTLTYDYNTTATVPTSVPPTAVWGASWKTATSL